MIANRGKARLGVLVPFTNANLEPDMALLAPEGVSIHVARLGGYDENEVPDSAQMAGLGAAELDEPLRLLCGVKPDVILYGCTSATLTHGPQFDRDLAAKVEAMSGAKTVTAAGALVTALTALGISRIGFASPYIEQINDQAVAFLAKSGFETVSRAGVGTALSNFEQGEISPTEVSALARRADSPDAEALVLSCTDMRSVEVLGDLEEELGKPVISSNQAMIFAALPHLNVSQDMTRYGRLLRLSPTPDAVVA